MLPGLEDNHCIDGRGQVTPYYDEIVIVLI